MSTMNSRLRDARIKAGFASARSAAIRHGWRVSTYAAHENGQNNFSFEHAVEYAQAYGVQPNWLILGEEQENQGSDESFVAVIGSIGLSGVVDLKERADAADIKIVKLREKISEFSVGFLVQGTGLWPRYDNNDLIIAFPAHIKPIYKSEELIVETVESVLLRTVSKKEDETWYALSSFNLPPTNELILLRAWKIFAIIPMDMWFLPEFNTIEGDAYSGDALKKGIWQRVTRGYFRSAESLEREAANSKRRASDINRALDGVAARHKAKNPSGK